jgi:hypothetical protein
MKHTATTLGGFVFLLSLGLIPNPLVGMPSAARADALNAKPGAWEMTFTTQSSGMLVPPDVLAAMPPEQRAKVEQSMQARAGKPRTHSVKTCITKEDLDQHRIIKESDDDEPGCHTTVLSKSAGKLVLERTVPARHLGRPNPAHPGARHPSPSQAPPASPLRAFGGSSSRPHPGRRGNGPMRLLDQEYGG